MTKLTLVLLPGMDGTGTLFAPLIAALGGAVTVRVIRYPGDIALGYSDLEALVRSQLPPRGRFLLLGESFSGPIAVSIAATRPRRLVGLVLCASFVRSPHALFAPLAGLTRFLPVKAAPPMAMRHLMLGRFATPALLTALQSALAQVSTTCLRERIKAVMAVDVFDKLTHINVPVLYLQAKDDRMVPSPAATVVAQGISGLQVARFDAPHLLLQAAPAAAARALLAFVDQVQSQPAR